MVNFGQPTKPKQDPQDRIDGREKVFKFDDNLKLKIIDARPHRWMIWDILIVLHLSIITGLLIGWRVQEKETSPNVQYCIWIQHCAKTDKWDVGLSQRKDSQHRWEEVPSDRCKLLIQSVAEDGSNTNTRVRIPWDQ